MIGARLRSKRRRGRTTRGPPAAVAAAVALLAVIAAPGDARGYVRTKTPGGVPEVLASRCLALEVHLDALPGVDPADARAA